MLDDGMNEIVYSSQRASRCQLAKFLNFMETGDFFNKSTGDLNRGLGMDYLKVTEWRIEPHRKGPVPDDLSYELPEDTRTFRNEFYSIDGERYPAQDISAKVLKKILPVYM